MVAGLVVALAACGGGDKPADTAATPEAATPAPAMGATHDVNMVQQGADYRFVPAELTIKVGDVVNFHNVSGGPHNIEFWADSIPAGAAAALIADMPGGPDKFQGELSSPLLTDVGATYSITFAGVPTGEYKFTCYPHMAMGMHGKLTVTQ